MISNSKWFFDLLLNHGLQRHDYFSRFSDSNIENAIAFNNIVPGVCPMFIMYDEYVEVILESRIPKKNSQKVLIELNKKSSEKIYETIGVRLVAENPGAVSRWPRVVITHKIPTERTDFTFKNFIEILILSMDTMIMEAKKIDTEGV